MKTFTHRFAAAFAEQLEQFTGKVLGMAELAIGAADLERQCLVDLDNLITRVLQQKGYSPTQSVDICKQFEAPNPRIAFQESAILVFTMSLQDSIGEILTMSVSPDDITNVYHQELDTLFIAILKEKGYPGSQAGAILQQLPPPTDEMMCPDVRRRKHPRWAVDLLTSFLSGDPAAQQKVQEFKDAWAASQPDGTDPSDYIDSIILRVKSRKPEESDPKAD